jgi:hypothetical protein
MSKSSADVSDYGYKKFRIFYILSDLWKKSDYPTAGDIHSL